MSRKLALGLLLCLVAVVTIGVAVATAFNPGHSPRHRSLPKISGSATAGATLHASSGRWRGAKKFVYEWQRCNAHGAKCKTIHVHRPKKGKLSHASNYRLTKADIGHRIRVTVIASNRNGKTAATSRATAIVRKARTAPATPSPTGSNPTPLPTSSSGLGIHVVGNHYVNGNGQTIELRGVLRNGPEYACQQGFGMTDGPSGDAEFSPMVAWHINSVFLGLDEQCLLGINGVKAQYAGQNYLNFVKSEVTSAEKYGIYPVIGFFTGDPGTDTPNWYDNSNGQPPLADNDHTPLFWEEIANAFKNDPNVIFRLQEEPHNNAAYWPTLSDWKCWSQGDVQYSPSSDRTPPTAPVPVSSVQHCNLKDAAGHAYSALGMQSMINIIRGTGATNVIQVPGEAYANVYSCSTTESPTQCGFLDSTDGVRVSDTLSPPQLGGDTDNYPDVGQDCGTVACFNATYAPVAAVMPIDSGELGVMSGQDSAGDFPLAEAFTSWMNAQGESYYGAAWDTWSDLISSYSGTAKAPWGTYFQTDLAANPG
jgi:endoglucanase